MNQEQLPSVSPEEQSPFSPERYFTVSLPKYGIVANCQYEQLTKKQLKKHNNKLSKLIEKFIIVHNKQFPNEESDIQKLIPSEFYFLNNDYFYKFEEFNKFALWQGCGFQFPKKEAASVPPEEYFINNNNGYENPYIHSLKGYGIEIKYYCNQLNENKLKEFKNTIYEVSKRFFEEFPNAKNSCENLAIIKIYIFNNKKDLKHLGYEIFNLSREKSQIGCHRYIGNSEVFSEIFIFQPKGLLGKINNLFSILGHELAHALSCYATKGQFSCEAPDFLDEGIAKYFETKHHSIWLTRRECAELTYKKLKLLSYKEQFCLLYRGGYAIVYYLQLNYPKLIDQYFTYFREEKFEKAAELLQSALSQPETIQKWLCQHNSRTTRTLLQIGKLIVNGINRMKRNHGLKTSELLTLNIRIALKTPPSTETPTVTSLEEARQPAQLLANAHKLTENMMAGDNDPDTSRLNSCSAVEIQQSADKTLMVALGEARQRAHTC